MKIVFISFFEYMVIVIFYVNKMLVIYVFLFIMLIMEKLKKLG